MNADDTDDDDAATVIGRADAARELLARPGVESPTARFDPRALSNPTNAMPAGYGMSRFQVPPPRASSPRPAAGRPAVPSVITEEPSASEMTLIEAIDAELESITAELSIPEITGSELLDDAVSASEMTVRLAVPDDLPSNLLDSTSEPGTQIQPPRAQPAPEIREGRAVPAPPLSLSSMPTPQQQQKARTLPMPPSVATSPAQARAAVVADPLTDIGGTMHEPTVDGPGGKGPVALATVDVVSAERPRGPAPKWVGGYIVVCAVLSILGALTLTYLKMQRFW
jgi:hypothetical protein